MVKNLAAPSRYEKAATTVWWNIDNCPIPKGCKPEEITQKITSALHKLNYRGEISIFAYGNMDHIPPSFKQSLSSTGITLEHVNSSFEKGETSSRISSAVFGWRIDNRAPANLMFISRDKIISLEEEWGYNILLAHPQHPSDSLVASAKTTWLWKSILEEPDI